ncbi:TPA: ABC transporter permease, partial [Klebsiella aerogenes]
MSKDMIFFNSILVLILMFVIYNVIFNFGDAKFSFLNLLRHRRRTISTLSAIILGGCAIFLYGGFINYSFWILKEQTIRTN